MGATLSDPNNTTSMRDARLPSFTLSACLNRQCDGAMRIHIQLAIMQHHLCGVSMPLGQMVIANLDGFNV